jgi:DnaJ-class molecular chaperone
MHKPLTSYDILNLSEQATQDDIHAAYRRLAKLWHPDANTLGNATHADMNFKLLQEAYHSIKTPDARSNYNQFLAKQNRTIMMNQNKIMNDNHPVHMLFKALDRILNPFDTRKGV